LRLLLDTHFAFWWQIGDPRAVAVRGLVESSEEAFISRGSLWELALKVSTGKLKADLAAFAGEVERLGFRWLPITNEHLLAVAELPYPGQHRDPFDRLLVAQSLSEPLTLLTADPNLAQYGDFVRVV